MIDPGKNFQFQFKKEPFLFDENLSILIWRVPKTLPYFEGHFPQNPILPAIAILDGSLEAVKIIENHKSIVLRKIKSAKFLNVITPDLLLELHLYKKTECDWEIQWKSAFQEAEQQTTFAQLKLEFCYSEFPHISV